MYRHLFSLMFAIVHGISLTTVTEEVALRNRGRIHQDARVHMVGDNGGALGAQVYAMENASDAHDTHVAAVWHGSKLMRDVLGALGAVGASVFEVRAGGSWDIVFVMDDHGAPPRLAPQTCARGGHQPIHHRQEQDDLLRLLHRAAGRAGTTRIVSDSAREQGKRSDIEVSFTGTREGVARRLRMSVEDFR